MLLAHLLNEVEDQEGFAPGNRISMAPMTARSSASPMEQRVLKKPLSGIMRAPARIASSLRGSISCRVYLCPDRGYRLDRLRISTMRTAHWRVRKPSRLRTLRSSRS